MEGATFKFFGACLTPNCPCTQFDGLLSGASESVCGTCGHAKYVHLPQEVVVVNKASANHLNHNYGHEQSSGFFYVLILYKLILVSGNLINFIALADCT